MVSIAVTTVFVQATRVYTSTSVHIDPQEQQMLAMKRIEVEMREAMFVNIVTASPSTWVELCLPRTDETGDNVVVMDANGELGLERDPAKDVAFFLGTKEYPNPADTDHWNAVPSATGHTIFRALSNTRTSSGVYPQATVIIDGVASTPMIPDPEHPGQEIAARLFEYWPSDPNDPTRPTRDTQLIVVTLTIPVQEKTGQFVNHTLRTQYCLRNWNSAQAPIIP
jgi:hypothetical protein